MGINYPAGVNKRIGLVAGCFENGESGFAIFAKLLNGIRDLV